MNVFRKSSLLLAGAFTATFCAMRTAAEEAPVVIPVNLGYPVLLTESSELVIYQIMEGEAPSLNSFKEFTEMQCEMSRRVGASSATPQFEAGWDTPLKSKNVTILAKNMKYEMVESHTYSNEPDAATGPRDICSGTYRVKRHRTVHIFKALADRTVQINFNLETQSGLISHDLPGQQRLDFRKMWGVFSNRWNTKVGEVAGISQVAGLPCASVITKYDEDNRTTERCLALAGDERKTPDVEGRTLRYSSTWFPKGAPKKYLWSATTELVPYGLIDSAVFDVPKGIKLKESIDDRLKVQK